MESKLIHVPATGVFYGGMASSYCEQLPEELEGIIDRQDFREIMMKLNDEIQHFWPCAPCVAFGYLCYPCTYFSCFPTNYCKSESEVAANEFLSRTNLRPMFREKNIKFNLQKNCCSSFVLVSIPSQLFKEKNNSTNKNNSNCVIEVAPQYIYENKKGT